MHIHVICGRRCAPVASAVRPVVALPAAGVTRLPATQKPLRQNFRELFIFVCSQHRSRVPCSQHFLAQSCAAFRCMCIHCCTASVASLSDRWLTRTAGVTAWFTAVCATVRRLRFCSAIAFLCETCTFVVSSLIRCCVCTRCLRLFHVPLQCCVCLCHFLTTRRCSCSLFLTR